MIRQTTTELLHDGGTQPLLFFVAPNGEPTPQTLAIALVMTCRDHDDVTRVLTPAHGIKTKHDAALLPNQIIDSCTDLQREFARYALKRAAGLALIKRTPIITTTENEHDHDDDSSSEESSLHPMPPPVINTRAFPFQYRGRNDFAQFPQWKSTHFSSSSA